MSERWEDMTAAGIPDPEIVAGPPGPVACTDDRLTILSVAGHFTTSRENAVDVAINASALLAWVEAATCAKDLQVRMRVLERHRANRSAGAAQGAELVMDDPDEFLQGVRTLYAFATAGRDQ